MDRAHRDRPSTVSPFSQPEDPQGRSVTVGDRGFPEPLQITTPTHTRHLQNQLEVDEDEGLDDRQGTLSEITYLPSYSTGINAMPFSPSLMNETDTSSQYVSSGSMMRSELSNQDIYVTRPRPRSFASSEDQQMDEDLFLPPTQNTEVVTDSSFPETAQFGQGSSPSLAQTKSISSVKTKKVKMHQCPECQKAFPRPSALRTHMNIHTNEKPFACTYPGCTATFSVASNAKRHTMRTHGVPLEDPSKKPSMSYVVDFETPTVVEPQPEAVERGKQVQAPFRVRWMQGSKRGSKFLSPETVEEMDIASGSGSTSSGNADADDGSATPRTLV